MIARKFTASLRRMLILALGLFFALSVAYPLHAQSGAQPTSSSGHVRSVLSETDQYRMSAPVVKLRNRSTAIQKHLVDARTATEEATARLSSVEDRLARLDDQIAAMRAQSEADSARDEQRILASVEDEKNKILAAAEAEIQSATTLARREIQKYAAELAVEQAARKLVVTAETDRLLVESFAHKLGEGSNN